MASLSRLHGGLKRRELEESKQLNTSRSEDEIDSIGAKKRKLEAAIAGLTASADSYAEKAEATSDDIYCEVKQSEKDGKREDGGTCRN